MLSRALMRSRSAAVGLAAATAALSISSAVAFSSSESGSTATASRRSPSIASYIDHTVLKQTCLESDIVKVCNEAKEFHFAAVCVPPNFVKLAKENTKGSDVKVATVIGFPFGYSCVAAKKAEILQALKDGADELDIVANISAIKNGLWDQVQSEITNLMPCRKCWPTQKVKVIIESGTLTDEEIVKCCQIYGAAGIDFLKTSTGYAEGGKGASVHAVTLFRQNLPESVAIKASGGIRDYAAASAMVAAGATRIGCSAGVNIVKGETGAATSGAGSGY